MLILLLGLLGLCFGSFLNVLIWRLNDPKAPKFWQGRSLCPNCRHELAWQDNIPLLSYLFLHGKCRYCRKAISWQYPVVELATGVYLAVVGWNPIAWLIGAAFIVIFFSDLIYGLIPDEMVLVVAAIFFIFQFSFFNFLTGIISGLLFLLLFLLTGKRGIGFGDIKLALVIGFLLGWPKTTVAFWAAFILGGIVALFLLTLRRTKLSATIPLGPFLVLGVLISALWSNQLVTLLLNF